MNLDSCTAGQRHIITTLDKPLMVSAGAGSGKTFTLTQRIAYALERRDGSEPFAKSIDEVLAITFTKKAAAELKSRIKHRLLDMGLAEEALKVDDAWISTIHGMCSRLLREHALEIGIDPAFEVISETQAARYRSEAFDEVVQAIEAGDNEELRAYLRSVSIRANAPRGASIEGYVTALTARVEALPQGFESLEVAHNSEQPAVLLKTMIELGEEFLAILESLTKLTKTDERNRDAMSAALEGAHAYLMSAPAASFDDEAFDSDAFAKVLFAFPKTSAKYHPKQIETSFFEDYRATYAQVAAEVQAGCAAHDLNMLIDVTQRVNEAYCRIKGPQCLDNTDLLRRTYQALCDYPQIAQAYRDQFSLIMIDEFQDTDELQVALIDMLAQPGRRNVCTVGDAQQSIYRFRGADVNVFYGYQEALAHTSPDVSFVTLPDNFRSHADILSFVDTIFSQPQVFGSRFLSLAPRGAVNTFDDPLFADRPRISMALFDCRKGGAGMAQGRRECAEHIARHFADLREGGASPDQMVILLGSMSKVDIYAQALRNAGFECLVAGGSTFSDVPEVALVQALLQVLVNQCDDEALYQVLVSPLFALDDDIMLHLTTCFDREGNVHRRSCAQGFMAWKNECGLTTLTEDESDRLDFAYQCIQAALQTCKWAGLAESIRHVIRASGWFIRLEGQGAQGQAVVGNVHKALRMIEEIEEEGLGFSRSVDRFIQDCATLKLTPGTLATTSSNFVRIMTIHASKGLEFPHVAVAELRLSSSSQPLLAENIDAATYVALQPRLPKAQSDVARVVRAYAESDDASAQGVINASSRGARMCALEAYTQEQELQEARRLLYVALTRASASLMVGVAYQGNKDFSYEGKGVLDDVYQALSWECSEGAPEQRIAYGGSQPLHLTLKVLNKPGEEPEAEQSGSEGLAIPAAPVPLIPFSHEYRAGHDEVFSYSSLPHESDASEADVSDAVEEPLASGVAVDAAIPNDTVVPGGIFDAAWGAAVDAAVPAESDEAPMFPDTLVPDEDATALGTAFHRLAQRAIDTYREGALVMPDEEAIRAQIRAQHLSTLQEQRLRRALNRWFASDVAQQFVACGTPRAEVPFMVTLGAGENQVFLEGEIDGLVIDEHGVAHVIDYKTGGSANETEQEIYSKHLLQAQCYAYALLSQGCVRVETAFVRVEQEDLRSGEQEDPYNSARRDYRDDEQVDPCDSVQRDPYSSVQGNSCDCGQPQIQRYVFEQSDKPHLERDILTKYKQSLLR